jgi:glycosyltransferase involved in cell wall biosynthesis
MLVEEVVSVIIPAYNAAATLDETLRSVRSQTYRNLEIVIVDDGSRDETVAIVEHHRSVDPRIRLIEQANAGVAAARNRGIAETSGRYIAPIDADDLWSPDKIERQVEAMRRGGGRVGLVYTWYAVIDGESRVKLWEARSEDEGDVLESMCLRNIVGNGSCALMLREAVEAAGGYDSGLRACGAQGCEDYKLYFLIAERYDFVLIRDYLTGYRELPDNMSSDVRQMLRSRDLCVREFIVRHPGLSGRFRRGRTRLMRFMLTRSIRGGRRRDAATLFAELLRHDPWGAALNISELFGRLAARKWSNRSNGGRRSDMSPRFEIGLPESADKALLACAKSS